MILRYIFISLLGLISCTSVTNRSTVTSRSNNESVKTLEKSKTDSLLSLSTTTDSVKNTSSYMFEKAEKLPFDNYNLYKDSVRVLDEFTLKFQNRTFIYQNSSRPRKMGEISQAIEWRPGIVTVEKNVNKDGFGGEISELRVYNKERKCINKWNMRANDPWKKELGIKLNLDTSYIEYGMSNIQANSKNLIPTYDYNHQYDYEVYKNSGNVVLYYFLSDLDEQMRVLRKSTYIIILDSLGKELFRYKDYKNIVNHAILTQDAKYLLINGGGEAGEGLQMRVACYLKIIDTKSNKVIYSEEKETLYGSYSEFINTLSKPNLIYVGLNSYNKKYCETSCIYNLDKLERCEKNYSNAECDRVNIEKIPFTPNNRLLAFTYTCLRIRK